MKFFRVLGFLPLILGGLVLIGFAEDSDYDRARWNPIHFPPAIYKAADQDCLACHQEILDDTVRAMTPAGVKATDTLAWYQTLDTYRGDQETFHRRHLVTPLAKQLMRMKCTTCHQGNDPREEAGGVPPDDQGFTLRKMVDPHVCQMCHSPYNATVMGLPGPWPQTRDAFQNNCLLCHAGIRTTRHQVNFLNTEAIEEAGRASGDSCYGCHGGRAWYSKLYPYPRHTWPAAPKEIPEWAKDRPTESPERFRE